MCLIRAWLAITELSEVEKPVNRKKWFMSPPTVNAYHMPEFNSMTFPAGILQPPFYRPNTIMALNYGGIGMVKLLLVYFVLSILLLLVNLQSSHGENNEILRELT